MCVCVWRRSAYTRVNAYRIRTGDVWEKEELEVRRGRRAFTVHMYVLLPLRTTHADRGVLEVGAPTRGREHEAEVEQEEEEDEVERGWMAETVSRANGIVSQCATAAYCVPRVSVKIHRSVGMEGRGTES